MSMMLNLGEVINKQLANKKIIITGASGWIGKALLEALYVCYGEKIKDYVLPVSFSSKFIELQNGVRISCYDYDEMMALDSQEVLLWHLAFVTKDKCQELSLEQYQAKNLTIRYRVAKIIDHFKITGMVYASSGAVYSEGKQLENNLTVNPYGYLKLEDEEFFRKLARAENFALLIPRIFNISGPYINKLSLYALSDFILQAQEKQEIEIKAKCRVVRSYVSLEDLYKVCFAWLLDEKKIENFAVFDTAHKQNVELAELALLVLQQFALEAKINREFDDDSRDNIYVGTWQEFYDLCSRYDIAVSSYEQQIACSKAYIKQVQATSKQF